MRARTTRPTCRGCGNRPAKRIGNHAAIFCSQRCAAVQALMDFDGEWCAVCADWVYPEQAWRHDHETTVAI